MIRIRIIEALGLRIVIGWSDVRAGRPPWHPLALQRHIPKCGIPQTPGAWPTARRGGGSGVIPGAEEDLGMTPGDCHPLGSCQYGAEREVWENFGCFISPDQNN